jgi:hypothetical protein
MKGKKYNGQDNLAKELIGRTIISRQFYPTSIINGVIEDAGVYHNGEDTMIYITIKDGKEFDIHMNENIYLK